MVQVVSERAGRPLLVGWACEPAECSHHAPRDVPELFTSRAQPSRQAGSLPHGERKVRAPQDRVVGNSDRPQGSGKCNRKQTAARKSRLGVKTRREGYRAVRVKRCGKSAPATGATRLARQTPPGARPNRASAHSQECARAGPVRFGVRVGCSRRWATCVLEKWPSRSPLLEDWRANRTRLTGPLRNHFLHFDQKTQTTFV
jgi:hypothetical protein